MKNRSVILGIKEGRVGCKVGGGCNGAAAGILVAMEVARVFTAAGSVS